MAYIIVNGTLRIQSVSDQTAADIVARGQGVLSNSQAYAAQQALLAQQAAETAAQDALVAATKNSAKNKLVGIGFTEQEAMVVAGIPLPRQDVDISGQS
jgi:hypothetical protein